MKLKESFKKYLLRKRHTVLSKPPGQFQVTDWKLAQMKNRGLDLKVVIDGGAADGWFAYIIKEIYPEAKLILLEPRAASQANLKQIAAQYPHVMILPKLIGDHVGEVELHESEDQSSIFNDAEGKPFGTSVKHPMTTIDQLMEELNLTPDLIKLDVQGAELQALAGAARSLAAAQAVLLEASLIQFQQGTPLLFDVMKFMDERGFRLHDILGLWHRPLDGALAQGDFLFLRNDHPLLKDLRWSNQGMSVKCWKPT